LNPRNRMATGSRCSRIEERFRDRGAGGSASPHAASGDHPRIIRFPPSGHRFGCSALSHCQGSRGGRSGHDDAIVGTGLCVLGVACGHRVLILNTVFGHHDSSPTSTGQNTPPHREDSRRRTDVQFGKFPDPRDPVFPSAGTTCRTWTSSSSERIFWWGRGYLAVRSGEESWWPNTVLRISSR